MCCKESLQWPEAGLAENILKMFLKNHCKRKGSFLLSALPLGRSNFQSLFSKAKRSCWLGVVKSCHHRNVVLSRASLWGNGLETVAWHWFYWYPSVSKCYVDFWGSSRLSYNSLENGLFSMISVLRSNNWLWPFWYGLWWLFFQPYTAQFSYHRNWQKAY